MSSCWSGQYKRTRESADFISGAGAPWRRRLYCQPIQMRLGAVAGFDMAQCNRWQWRPDYEGLELGTMRCGMLPAHCIETTECQCMSMGWWGLHV